MESHPGAPGRCPWERMGSFGGRSGIWLRGAGAAAGDARLRGDRLLVKAKPPGPRARSARSREGRGGGGEQGGRSSESRARRARSTHHGSVARRRLRHGGAGAVPELEPLPARSASQRRSRAPARGSQGAPAPRAPTLSILPLQVWRRLAAGGARGGPGCSGEGGLERAGPATLATGGWTSALPGPALPGNFLCRCRRLRVRGRGASRRRSPPPSPAPARALLPWGALARERLLPPRGSAADQCDRLPPRAPLGARASLSRGCCRGEHAMAPQGLPERGFLQWGRSAPGSPRPLRPEKIIARAELTETGLHQANRRQRPPGPAPARPWDELGSRGARRPAKRSLPAEKPEGPAAPPRSLELLVFWEALLLRAFWFVFDFVFLLLSDGSLV